MPWRRNFVICSLVMVGRCHLEVFLMFLHSNMVIPLTTHGNTTNHTLIYYYDSSFCYRFWYKLSHDSKIFSVLWEIFLQLYDEGLPLCENIGITISTCFRGELWLTFVNLVNARVFHISYQLVWFVAPGLSVRWWERLSVCKTTVFLAHYDSMVAAHCLHVIIAAGLHCFRSRRARQRVQPLCSPTRKLRCCGAQLCVFVQPRNFCHGAQLSRNFGRFRAVFALIIFHFGEIWGKLDLWAPVIFPFRNL